MTIVQSLYNTYKRYRTLQTGTIRALPVVILMPHSACNCRCVMCDIWKDNSNLKQITEKNIKDLLVAFKKLGTQQVLMSGGEALLHPYFFKFCELLRRQGLRISLLSTGLSLKKNATQLVQHVNDIIVSLDGDEITHNYIRNVPDAYRKLKEGIECIKTLQPDFSITARTVIHRINFRKWPAIVDSAKQMRIGQISFLPADISSHAFNRDVLWSNQRQQDILPSKDELNELERIIDSLIKSHASDFDSGFIAESPDKLEKIYSHYAAFHGLNPFPYKKCNAPWVSAVIEADGTVRPCFFHASLGNIHENSLEQIINDKKAVSFRKRLDINANDTCLKCVCYLNLAPGTKLN